MIKALVGAIKHDTFLLETYDGISALSIWLKTKSVQAVNEILDYISKHPSFEYTNQLFDNLKEIM
jgi:hypothetical protein